MTVIQVIFYAFSAVVLCSGLMVVVSRNPVHSVLFLVLAFVGSAGLWILLHAEFLALILVLVYVGAVMTLFLFVVMMLSLQGVLRKESFVRYLPVSAMIVLAVVGLIILVLNKDHLGLQNMPAPALKPADFSDVSSLGLVLYTDYAFPFEVAGVLLLTAIVAAIGLTHRLPHQRKVQNIDEQIATRPQDRVRLVKMPAVKKDRPSEGGA